jgi:hypothetical protein
MPGGISMRSCNGALLEPRLLPEEEMRILDALLTDGLIFADPTLRPMLDQWSLRAVQLGPEIKTLAGTRGAVLVELGRYQEGKALLEPLARADTTPPFDTLMTEIFLAHAEHALGDAGAATELMTRARAAIATQNLFRPNLIELIERIQREINGAPLK